MAENNLTDKMRLESWDNSFYSFGTAYIFNKRAQRFSAYVNLLKVFGIVVPVTVGATAIGYGMDSSLLKLVINLAIPLSILQLMISVLAVIYKWDDELAYSYESSNAHSYYFQEFKLIGNLPITDENELKRKFDVLVAKLQSRAEQDDKHYIKEWENRMGMKYSLRQHQKKCVGCDEIPVSMNSTNCYICGKYDNFTTKIFRL